MAKAAEDDAGSALTPERATAEALAAVKAAGLGKERGKPFTVASRHYGRVPVWTRAGVRGDRGDG